MSKEKLLEIRKYLSQALLIIDDLLSKESTLPRIELKERGEIEEIEEIPWKKLGRWEYSYIHNFSPSFIQQLKDKGYLSKDGYVYKLKKDKYGITVIRKKVIEKF